MGVVMNRFLSFSLLICIFLCILKSVACPTCIGLPQKGSRPFFEKGTITYIIQTPTSENASPDKNNEPTQDSTESEEE